LIDYRVHIAALDAFREQLALTPFDDATVAAIRDDQVSAADQASAAAMLGIEGSGDAGAGGFAIAQDLWVDFGVQVACSSAPIRMAAELIGSAP
jgi:hypothetical protein